MNLVVPKLEYVGEIWKGNARLVKQLGARLMATAKEYYGAQQRREWSIESRIGNVPISKQRNEAFLLLGDAVVRIPDQAPE